MDDRRRPHANPRHTGPQGPAAAPRGQRKKLPIAVGIAIDTVAAALLLGIFYVTNYMVEVDVKPVPLPTHTTSLSATVSPSAAPSAPLETATVAPTGSTQPAESSAVPATATPAATVDTNDWRAKFADKFTGGDIKKTATSYQSANISITIDISKKYGVTCYIADIYVADIKYFRTAFAKRANVMGAREMTDKVATENDAILAINGDHCVDNPGTVVRNGQLFREPKASSDVFVMNNDGSMQAFSPDAFDVGKIKSDGAYQVWTFGPMLLKDGQPMKQFNSTLGDSNPRTAVGYFEPGHYCFLVVGGRQKGYSEGYTLQQLSQIMADLGCKEAYNLDGGRSSEMIFLGKMLNQQASGRRSTTDILYIGDK